MIDSDKAAQIKERIISIVKMRGPSLPVHIAKSLNISPLFTSAFLSELYGERKLVMSYMKIGSSSLYLLPEQEPMLENFIPSLSMRERDAVLLLKSKKLLEDSSLTPVIRVALRGVQDFAIPIKIKIDPTKEPQIFWKYFLLKDEEIKNYISQDLVIEQKKEEQIVEKTVEIKPLETQKVIEKHVEAKPSPEPLKEIIRMPQKEEITEDKQKAKKTKKQKEFAFPNKLKDYLSSQNIEILEIIDEKSKELIAKIRTIESFGKQEYYLVAKDKKKILEIDLIVALQKSQENKMPVMIMSPGEIDKKAIEFFSSWKNMIKFIKIKL
jgi:hypothetical protein